MLTKRLTFLSSQKQKKETEEMGFSTEEYENMQEYFDQQIKKSDAKHVLKIIEKMFKDIKNAKLKKYFIESLTKHVSIQKF